jgi:cysteine synthase B
MEGWKHLETARVPRIYDPEAADESRSVSTDKAYNMIVEAARKQDLLLSPSSAANLSGALQLASELDRGIVVTIFPDDSSKYSEVYSHLNL